MPTKTNAQRKNIGQELELLVPVRLTTADELDLQKILGLKGIGLARALKCVRETINFGNSQIGARISEPLPANLLAALAPTVRHAEALMRCLVSLPSACKFTTRADELERSVRSWLSRASYEQARLEAVNKNYADAVEHGEPTPHGGSDGGARKRNVRLARDEMRDELRSLYSRLATDRDVRREAAFIRAAERIARRKPSKEAVERLIESL